MEVVQTGNNGETPQRGSASRRRPSRRGRFRQPVRSVSRFRSRPSCRKRARSTPLLELRAEKKPFQVEAGIYADHRSVFRLSARHHRHRYRCPLTSIWWRGRTGRAATPSRSAREGLQYKGAVKVGDKQEWPRWIPTKEMQRATRRSTGQYTEGMPGGGQNRSALAPSTSTQNGKDTHLRIHGTIAPQTIGTDSSNGCFRMINEHVMDLYRRVAVGTKVVVL